MSDCDHDCDRFDKISNLTWGYFQIDDADLAVEANGAGYVRYADFNHSTTVKHEWFQVDYCSGSDYSGDLLHKSNYRVLLEECEKALKDSDTCQEPWFVKLVGGHGTFAIVLHCERSPEEIFELIEKLDNYPVLDEDDYSQLQMDEESEAWDSWARSDFKRALEKRFPQHDWDEVSDDEIYEYFRYLVEESNTYWEVEGMGMHIDIERLMKHADEDDEKLPKAKPKAGWKLTDDLDGLRRRPTSGNMKMPAWIRPRGRK